MTQKGRVAPFGDPRIKGCSPLPAAFRSVPRPSSPLSAKASTKCPYALDPKPRRRTQRAKPPAGTNASLDRQLSTHLIPAWPSQAAAPPAPNPLPQKKKPSPNPRPATQTASRIPIHNVKEQRTEDSGRRTKEVLASPPQPNFNFPRTRSAHRADDTTGAPKAQPFFCPLISVLAPPAPGGADRDRTGDLLLAKQALSQLSYGPSSQDKDQRTEDCPGRTRRRTTLLSSDLCPLSPESWWAREDLNFRPHAYQARALTS